MRNDLISKEKAIQIVKNHQIMKEPEETDTILIESYKAGYRDALKQVEMDLEDMLTEKKLAQMKAEGKRKKKEIQRGGRP